MCKYQESIIEKLFKNMDKNGDGVVTKEVHIVKDIKLFPVLTMFMVWPDLQEFQKICKNLTDEQVPWNIF